MSLCSLYAASVYYHNSILSVCVCVCAKAVSWQVYYVQFVEVGWLGRDFHTIGV